MYYIYILECQNGSYYTGYTTDLTRRYREHCSGSAKCKYTRAYPPIRIAASWELDCELGMVLSLEYAIKQLTRHEKELLINDPQLLDINDETL
jgi:putative endonuclease